MNDKLNKMHAAFTLWRSTFKYDKTYVTLQAFAAFLGDPFNPYDAKRQNMIVNIDNPEVMKKIDIILGPNGLTILKMWKIQQESDNENA